MTSWPCRAGRRLSAHIPIKVDPTIAVGVGDGSVERWNGTTWTIQQDAGGGFPRAVSCPTVSRCTAVGGGNGNSGYAEYWDGTSWTAQDTPVPHGTTNGASLHGVSCQSVFHCTAVGTYGRFGHPLAEREN